MTNKHTHTRTQVRPVHVDVPRVLVPVCHREHPCAARVLQPHPLAEKAGHQVHALALVGLAYTPCRPLQANQERRYAILHISYSRPRVQSMSSPSNQSRASLCDSPYLLLQAWRTIIHVVPHPPTTNQSAAAVIRFSITSPPGLAYDNPCRPSPTNHEPERRRYYTVLNNFSSGPGVR